MSLVLRLICLLFLLVPCGASAATYPAHGNLFVNDYAALLDAGAETRLQTRLQSLRRDSGVEMTVLTLGNWIPYADPDQSFEQFATGLFNAWGVGSAKRNDGILVLISKGSRDIRVELGDGYGWSYNAAAAGVVEQSFLPDFRDGQYQAGIEKGVAAIISDIALTHAKGQMPPLNFATLLNRLFPWIFGAFAAAIVGTSLFGRLVGDWSFRFRRCPQCGQVGMHRAHVTGQMGPNGMVDVTAPAPATQSSGFIVTTCLHCSYRDQRSWRSESTSSSSSGGGSFGGGSSSGGGASGKW